MKTTKKIHTFIVPDYDMTLDKINFTVSLDGKDFIFYFIYTNTKWIAWCKLPSGLIRNISVVPNVLTWWTYTDYTLTLVTTDSQITKDNLAGQRFVIFEWLQ